MLLLQYRIKLHRIIYTSLQTLALASYPAAVLRYGGFLGALHTSCGYISAETRFQGSICLSCETLPSASEAALPVHVADQKKPGLTQGFPFRARDSACKDHGPPAFRSSNSETCGLYCFPEFPHRPELQPPSWTTACKVVNTFWYINTLTCLELGMQKRVTWELTVPWKCIPSFIQPNY